MQFPPFNRVVRRSDAAAANETVLDEEEADPTLTALKNAFQYAAKGIKMLDAGSGSGNGSSLSSLVTMGVEDGRNAFEIAYLAADASAAQAQQPGQFGDEVRKKADAFLLIIKKSTHAESIHHPVKTTH